MSLVNSMSSRRAQKSGQDAPKLISRPSREAFRASRTSISIGYSSSDRSTASGPAAGASTAECPASPGGTLRAVICNGDFGEYWRFHLTREHERLHPAGSEVGSRQVTQSLQQDLR